MLRAAATTVPVNQRWGWCYDQAWVRCMMAESSDYVFRADEKTAAGAHYLVYMTKDETRAVSFLMADGGVAEQIYWFGLECTLFLFVF